MADIRQLIRETADDLGISPIDLATVMSYETGGTMNPMQVGGIRTRFGTHRGFIQFGEPQARQYGVDFSSPEAAIQTQLGRGKAVSQYLKNAGVRPGTNLLGLEAAINGGNVGATNAVDNGSTVVQKVSGMGSHQKKAAAFMGGSGNFTPVTTGGTGMLPPGYGDKGTDIAGIDFGDPTSYLPPEKSPYGDLASTFADAVGGTRKGLAGEQTLAPDQGAGAAQAPPAFEYGSAIPSTPPPASDQPPPGSLAADASNGAGGLADLFKVGDFGQAGAAIDPATGLPMANNVLRTRRSYG